MHKGTFATFYRITRWLALRAVFVLLIICVVAAVAWTYFNIKLGRQLEAELARLRASGAPLTLAQAAPKPVPESENAAVLYQKVFGVRFPRDTTPEHPLANMSTDERTLIDAYGGGSTPPGIVTDVTRDESGTVTVRQGPEKPPSRSEVDARVAALLEKPNVVDALAVLRKASEMPHCVFPVDWAAGPAALFPHLTEFRAAARLVCAQARLTAGQGDVDAALDWCMIALRMSEQAAVEPTLAAQLVCVAMQGTAFSAMQSILSSSTPSAQAAARLDEYLGRLDLTGGFVRGLEGERACVLGALTMRVGFDVAALAQLAAEVWPNGAKALWFRAYGRIYCSPLGAPLRKAEEIIYLKYMGEQTKTAPLPYRETKPGVEAAEWEVAKAPVYPGVIARSILPTYAPAAAMRDKGIVQIAECRIVLALKGYKQQHRAYPANLADLQATLDRPLPLDPFSGKDFIYRTEDRGFILYSVGRDLKDDQGQAPTPETHGAGDIVWTCEQ